MRSALVLLVDDDPDNREILRTFLEHAGMRVIEAADGEAGVRLAREEAPGLILMDVSLPLLDGWAATRALKSDPATAAIPVVAMTGHVLDEHRERAKEVGCDAYLAKPVEPRRVVELVERMLDPGEGREPARAREEAAVLEGRAEAERRQRLYETIVATTPDLVYVFDLDYRFTFANAALLGMWGRTLEDSVGKSLLEIGYEPWHAEMHERELDRVVATKRPIRGEVAFPHKTLGRRIYDYIFAPVLDANGEVEAIAGTTRDVTDRKEAEEALGASEKRLRLALDSADFGSWDLDLRSRRSLSRSARHDRIFGYAVPLEEWSWERFLEHVHPDDRKGVDRSFQGALARGGTWDFECRITRADGELRWIWARGGVYGDEEGRPARALGIIADVTERKRNEEERLELTAELRVERSRLREIFKHAPSFLAVLRGPSYVFEMVNDAYEQLVGHRDVLGKPLWEALPEVRGQGFEALLDDVFSTGMPFVGREVPIRIRRTPDAEPEQRYLDFIYYPLIEADGSVSGIVAHGTDVTDHVVARHEVEAARARAEEANQAKSSFLATMSHELRTPLNGILGYAGLLDAQIAGPLNEQQRQQIGRIDAGARHLIRLVEEVLSFARVEAGKEQVRRESADASTLARETAGLIEPLAHGKGLRFHVHGSDTPMPMETDTGKLRQILLNLLSNAVKFTNAGEVGLETRLEHGEAVFRVRDTGIGIALDDMERIFEPFHQAGRSITEPFGGTGLGLSVARELSRLLGGDLTVESTPGKGSTFTVRLPREVRVTA